MVIMYFAWLSSKTRRKSVDVSTASEDTPLLGTEHVSTSAWFHDIVDVNTVDLKVDEYEEEQPDDAQIRPRQSLLRSLYNWVA